MTPTEINNAARDIYNAVGDSFFTDSQIYNWIWQACHILAKEAWLIERVYTASTVGGTQGYAYPTNTIAIKRITVNGKKIKRITGREDDALTLSNSNVSSQYVFTITSANATSGATYTNNGQTFTVVTTIVGATTLTCTGTGNPSSSGTLTLSTGTGSATITFSSFTINTASSGWPVYYSDFNYTIMLRPIPDGVYTIQIYSYNDAQQIVATSVLEIPTLFHFDVVDYVVMRMFGKDKDTANMLYYAAEWKDHVKQAVHYKNRLKRTDSFATVQSEDCLPVTILGEA